MGFTFHTRMLLPSEPVSQQAIPEKKKNRGKGRLRTYVFEKTPGIFRFLFYPWKFQTKQGITPRNSTKLCYTPQKFQGLKPTRPIEIQHGF